MISRLLNRVLDGLFVQGLTPFWARRLNGRILCLVYHRVSDAPPDFLEWGGVPTTTRRGLRADLACLKGWGGRFMTFADLRAGARPAPDAPNFVVSFDDGFRDTYENGLPVLNELGITGVVFQVAELIDGADLNWEHALYRYAYQPETQGLLRDALNEMIPAEARESRDMQALVKTARDTIDATSMFSMLDGIKSRVADRTQRRRLAAHLYPRASTIRAAQRDGHEIGSHGSRHIARRFLSEEAFKQDVSEAGAVIEHAANARPGAYAYPFGCHRRNDPEVLAGLCDQAVIATPGTINLDQPYALKRCLWPGPARNALRRRRWLLTGRLGLRA